MPISYRPATIDDAASIARVQLDGWVVSYAGVIDQSHLNTLTTPQELARKTDNQRTYLAWSHNIFVACDDDEDNRVVGFVAGWPPKEEMSMYDTDAEIYALYVSPSYQWQWIGTQLFGILMDALRTQWYHTVWRDTLQAMIGSVAFYTARGAIPRAISSREIDWAHYPTQCFVYHLS